MRHGKGGGAETDLMRPAGENKEQNLIDQKRHTDPQRRRHQMQLIILLNPPIHIQMLTTALVSVILPTSITPRLVSFEFAKVAVEVVHDETIVGVKLIKYIGWDRDACFNFILWWCVVHCASTI